MTVDRTAELSNIWHRSLSPGFSAPQQQRRLHPQHCSVSFSAFHRGKSVQAQRPDHTIDRPEFDNRLKLNERAQGKIKSPTAEEIRCKYCIQTIQKQRGNPPPPRLATHRRPTTDNLAFAQHAHVVNAWTWGHRLKFGIVTVRGSHQASCPELEDTVGFPWRPTFAMSCVHARPTVHTHCFCPGSTRKNNLQSLIHFTGWKQVSCPALKRTVKARRRDGIVSKSRLRRSAVAATAVQNLTSTVATGTTTCCNLATTIGHSTRSSCWHTRWPEWRQPWGTHDECMTEHQSQTCQRRPRRGMCPLQLPLGWVPRTDCNQPGTNQGSSVATAEINHESPRVGTRKAD